MSPGQVRHRERRDRHRVVARRRSAICSTPDDGESALARMHPAAAADGARCRTRRIVRGTHGGWRRASRSTTAGSAGSFVLGDDLVRVLFAAPERPARAAHVDGRAGRRRRAVGRARPARRGCIPAPAIRARRRATTGSSLQTTALRCDVRLQPVRPRLGATGADKPVRRRPADARVPVAAQRSGIVAPLHGARRAATSYFGLGDKTGPLDKHGRRLRTLALDALGYDARDQRSALQALAVPARARSARRGVALRPLLRHAVRARPSTSAASTTTTTASIATAEIDDGDLDYYLFVGPDASATSCASSPISPARMAFGRAGAWATPTPR